METMISFVNIFGQIFEMIIVHNYFKTVFKDNGYYKKKIMTVYVLVFLSYTLSKIYLSNDVALFIFFLGILCASFCFKASATAGIVSTLIIMTLFIVVETFTGLLFAFLHDTTIEQLTVNHSYFIQIVILSKLISFIIIQFFGYFCGGVGTMLSKRIFFALISMPVATTILVYTIAGQVYVVSDNKEIFFIMLAIFMVIIANVVLFYLFEKHMKQEKEKVEFKIREQKLLNQNQYFERLVQQYQRCNQMIHDSRNRLFAIKGYITNNEIDCAISNIEEMCGTIFCDEYIKSSGYHALDAVISVKVQYMQNCKIEYHHDMFICDIGKIDEMDLCVIFGNALDNAIEACNKITGKKEKWISSHMYQVRDLIVIEIKNTAVNQFKFDKGEIVTSKKDKIKHGMGLKSIEEIVDKYDGSVEVAIKDEVFRIKLYLSGKKCPVVT